MYMTCIKCGSKHFLVNIVQQVNGSDDTYEYVCAGCGDCVDLYHETDSGIDDSYLVAEIDKVAKGNGSICLEKWVYEGNDVYLVTIYRGDEVLCDRDFNTPEEADKCYKKCTDIFESIGDIDKVVKLFDEC